MGPTPGAATPARSSHSTGAILQQPAATMSAEPKDYVPMSSKPSTSRVRAAAKDAAAPHEQQPAAAHEATPAIIDPLEMIRPRGLATLLGVNTWTLSNWRKRGRIPLPIVLSPQVVVWRRVDIDRWLRERERRPMQARRSPNPKSGQ
jgi:predicted DNA-binding transcriptional regulator AlpA